MWKIAKLQIIYMGITLFWLTLTVWGLCFKPDLTRTYVALNQTLGAEAFRTVNNLSSIKCIPLRMLPMKKLLPLAVASLFVLSGSVFAAETAAAPAAAAETQQAAAPAHHKAVDKSKQHKKHAKKKAEAQKPAQPEAQQPVAK